MNSFKRLLQYCDRFMPIRYVSVIVILAIVAIVVMDEDVLW